MTLSVKVTARITLMDRNWLSNTANIELELSTECNVDCAACARINNDLYNKHFEYWQRLFQDDLKDVSLKCITFTSHWGDPLSHPDIVKIIDLISQTHPDVVIEITTSLNYGNEVFYQNLGAALAKFKHARILTNVYGNHHSHKIFRRCGDLNNVILASKTLSSSVDVFWNYPLFKFNQDDFSEVVNIGKDCGIHSIRSSLYHNQSIYQSPDQELGDEAEVIWFESADDPIFEEEDWNHTPFIEIDKNDSFEEDCGSLYARSVWIDPWGGVWPCFAIGKHSMDFEDLEGVVVDRSIQKYGYFNNLKDNNFTDILQHEWYTDVLPNSQVKKPWTICKEECDLCGT